MIGKRTILGATAFLLLSALAMNEAGSADVKQRFKVRGLGATSCGKYLEARNLDAKKSEEDYANWFTGFITAYNWLRPDTYDISQDHNAHALLRYLDLHCGRNPKDKIFDGAISFVNAVYAKRQKTGS
jgi:hypothetical protein